MPSTLRSPFLKVTFTLVAAGLLVASGACFSAEWVKVKTYSTPGYPSSTMLIDTDSIDSAGDEFRFAIFKTVADRNGKREEIWVKYAFMCGGNQYGMMESRIFENGVFKGGMPSGANSKFEKISKDIGYTSIRDAYNFTCQYKLVPTTDSRSNPRYFMPPRNEPSPPPRQTIIEKIGSTTAIHNPDGSTTYCNRLGDMITCQ